MEKIGYFTESKFNEVSIFDGKNRVVIKINVGKVKETEDVEEDDDDGSGLECDMFDFECKIQEFLLR